MKTSHSLASAVAFAGLLSASAFATTPAAHQRAIAGLKFEKPAPSSVVSPTKMPSSFEGRTVNVTMTIDAAGQPHNIKVVSANDRSLTQSLIAAISQWSFTPARKNGVAVPAKVLLPVEVVRS
ncbi:MAG: Gram-negative bacterial tonB protein [Lacunisphaera sp.]|nr:Gram-negative bacterial tonB protein [Lacunisphaera sp.]